MIPKEIKYNLHYDDVRGDHLRPPHGTAPATVEYRLTKTNQADIIGAFNLTSRYLDDLLNIDNIYFD